MSTNLCSATMTPLRLLDAAREIYRVYPDAQLTRNSVGNIAVVDKGEFRGMLNIRTGEFDVDGCTEFEAEFPYPD